VAKKIKVGAKPYAKKAEKTDDQKLRDKWLDILKDEDKANRKKRDRAQKVCELYADDRKDGDVDTKFNILWANTQVLAGALYSKTPKPDVRRRFLDKDPISRDAAAVIERGISYTLDSYDFDGTIDSPLNDYLVAGYGQVRIRYVPYFGKGQPQPIEPDESGKYLYNGEEVEPDENGMHAPEEIVYQEITCEPLEWKKFRWDHLAKRWEDTNWACIDHYMTKEELKENFGKIASKITLTHSENGKKEGAEEETHTLVHEIFDKKKRRIIVVSEGYKAGPIEIREDDLNLVGFYPFPKPMFATQVSGTMFPRPDYIFYQDQAEELNRVTARIDKLVDALRVRGVYDQSFEELRNVLQTDDGQLTPVKDFAARFDGKSLDSVFLTMPLADIANVVQNLYQQRDQIKATIYEITGIADIVRGSTNPNETLGAQQLKGQFADMRLTRRRNKVNAFLRDIVRIKAEILAEHFEPMTLRLMTGVDVNDQIMEILRSDVLRGYKIDVETDSTIATDAGEEQANRLDALNSLSTFLAQAVPAVQGGFIQPEIVKELALFGIRGFKHARQLEDVIERMGADDQDNPDAMKQKLMQAQQQIQQMQQQLQEGQQMLDEATKKADGKEMEINARKESDQAKIAAEEKKHAADMNWQREQYYNEHAPSVTNLEQIIAQISSEFGKIREAMAAPKPVTFNERGQIVSIGNKQIVRGQDGKPQAIVGDPTEGVGDFQNYALEVAMPPQEEEPMMAEITKAIQESVDGLGVSIQTELDGLSEGDNSEEKARLDALQAQLQTVIDAIATLTQKVDAMPKRKTMTMKRNPDGSLVGESEEV